MKLSNHRLTIFFTGILGTTLLAAAPMQPPNGNPFGQLSQQELDMLREIDEAVSKMSPEEREAFTQQVEKVQRNLEKMPEEKLHRFLDGSMNVDELDTFFKEAIGEEPVRPPVSQSQPPSRPTPTPSPLEPSTPKKPERPAVEQNTQKRMIRVITDTMHTLESILHKLQSYPEIDLKIHTWRTKNQIAGWRSDAGWLPFKYEVTKLIQRLRTLLTQDLSSKKYVYSEFITSNTALIDQLDTWNKELKSVSERIEISPFGIEKMSDKAKEAVKTALRLIVMALEQQKLPTTIDEVVAKYEPEAKKLREYFESLEKKAAQESQRVTPGQLGRFDAYRPWSHHAPWAGGSGSYGRPDLTSPFRPTAGGSGFTPGRFSPGYGGQGYQPHRFPSSTPGSRPEPPRRPTLGARRTQQTPGSSPVALNAQDLTNDFDAMCTYAAELIKHNDTLRNLSMRLIDRSLLDEKFQEDMNELNTALGLRKDGLLDILNRIENKIASLTPEEQNKVRERVGIIFDRHAPMFDIVTDQARKAAQVTGDVPPAKRFWYLGQTEKTATTPAPALTAAVLSTAQQREVKPFIDALKNLDTAIATTDEFQQALDTFVNLFAPTAQPVASQLPTVGLVVKEQPVQEAVLNEMHQIVRRWLTNIRAGIFADQQINNIRMLFATFAQLSSTLTISPDFNHDVRALQNAAQPDITPVMKQINNIMNAIYQPGTVQDIEEPTRQFMAYMSEHMPQQNAAIQLAAIEALERFVDNLLAARDNAQFEKAYAVLGQLSINDIFDQTSDTNKQSLNDKIMRLQQQSAAPVLTPEQELAELKKRTKINKPLSIFDLGTLVQRVKDKITSMRRLVSAAPIAAPATSLPIQR